MKIYLREDPDNLEYMGWMPLEDCVSEEATCIKRMEYIEPQVIHLGEWNRLPPVKPMTVRTKVFNIEYVQEYEWPHTRYKAIIIEDREDADTFFYNRR